MKPNVAHANKAPGAFGSVHTGLCMWETGTGMGLLLGSRPHGGLRGGHLLTHAPEPASQGATHAPTLLTGQLHAYYSDTSLCFTKHYATVLAFAHWVPPPPT